MYTCIGEISIFTRSQWTWAKDEAGEAGRALCLGYSQFPMEREPHKVKL